MRIVSGSSIDAGPLGKYSLASAASRRLLLEPRARVEPAHRARGRLERLGVGAPERERLGVGLLDAREAAELALDAVEEAVVVAVASSTRWLFEIAST